MTHSGANIERIATEKGMDFCTVIPSQYQEVEYLAVTIKPFTTAFFLMDNTTFDYTYSHTYNAATDKTTKRTPSGF